MTLFVLVYGIANIALGYGLAVYLGHAQGRVAKTVRAARSQQVVEQPPVEETWQDTTAFAPPPEPVVPEPVVEPVAPEPVVASAASEVVEPVAAAPEPPEPVVETPPVAEAPATDEPALEEEVLNKLEEVRAEIHDMPAPATMVEALASPAEPTSTEPVAVDETAESKPVSKEALLESINAFQAQLKKQQELAKLHAVTSK